VNRARIIRALNERPSNANQLTELLGLDYKTVRHHLKVLMDNKIITATGDRYGTVYFLSSCMEKDYEVFKDHLDKMWDKFKFKSEKDIDNKEI
jgi:DNA-binding transcriptional ArsR family regulator